MKDLISGPDLIRCYRYLRADIENIFKAQRFPESGHADTKMKTTRDISPRPPTLIPDPSLNISADKPFLINQNMA